MRRNVLGILVSGVLAVTTAGCSAFGGRAAEEPPFATVVSEPPFEIRDYAAMTVVRTTVEAPDRDQAVREGFMRLFDYISGANTGQADIAMTAPVMTQPAGEKIAMTAPVLQTETGQGWETVFVLPEGMEAAAAPVPTDARVSIGTIPARRVAVVRFAGILDAGKIAANKAELSRWLAARGETPGEDWQAAGYNPPWTIPSLRRNEVMVGLR